MTYAHQAKIDHRFAAQRHSFPDHQLLLLVPLAQYILALAPTPELITNSKAHSRKSLRSDDLDDAGKTIMATGGSTGAEPDLAKRQREVIRDHQRALADHVIVFHPITHSLSAEVHERLRFEANEGLTLMSELRTIRISIRGEGGIR